MEDEPHEVVKLLLARMESHPEEFKLKDPSYHDRWYNHMSAINTHGSEVDKAALAAKVRDIRMGEVHEKVLDELCNGEDRRRKEEEDAEYERHLAHAARQQQAVQRNALLTKHQMAQQAQSALQGSYANQLGAAAGVYDYDLDRYRNAGVTHIAGQGPSLKAGITTGSILPVAKPDNTITNTVNQIMRKLGKGK